MHVLVFRHISFEHLGMIGPALEAAGVSFSYVDLVENADAPVASASASGLIFMGGPMSANDDLPYIRRELELIGEAVSRELPILGICLGSQLIAKALGARVYPNGVS